MAYKTLQLPEDVHAKVNELKIRLAGTTGKIPTNVNLIRQVLSLADKHYDELVTELTKDAGDES